MVGGEQCRGSLRLGWEKGSLGSLCLARSKPFPFSPTVGQLESPRQQQAKEVPVSPRAGVLPLASFKRAVGC